MGHGVHVLFEHGLDSEVARRMPDDFQAFPARDSEEAPEGLAREIAVGLDEVVARAPLFDDEPLHFVGVGRQFGASEMYGPLV